MKNTYIVYKHTNKINKKIYIGITCRKPEIRWQEGRGYMKSRYFYNAIKKYGWDNFSHDILFSNLSKREAEQIEIELIAYFNCNQREFGYNIQKSGNLGNAGLKLTKEHRAKISKANMGRVFPEDMKKKFSQDRMGAKNPMYGKKASKETKEKRQQTFSSKYPHGIRAIPIICIETQRVFNSIIEASKELNINRTHISSVCNGKRKSVGGLHFVYLKDYKQNKKYDLSIGDNCKKRIICLETNEIFESIHEAGRKLNIKFTYISDVIRGRYKSTCGLHFKQIE